VSNTFGKRLAPVFQWTAKQFGLGVSTHHWAGGVVARDGRHLHPH